MDAIHCVWQQERIPARRQCAAASSAFRIARHLPRVVRSQPHQPARRAHLCLAIPRRAFPVELQVAVLAPGTHRDLKLLLRHEFRPAGGLSDVWGSGRNPPTETTALLPTGFYEQPRVAMTNSVCNCGRDSTRQPGPATDRYGNLHTSRFVRSLAGCATLISIEEFVLVAQNVRGGAAAASVVGFRRWPRRTAGRGLGSLSRFGDGVESVCCGDPQSSVGCGVRGRPSVIASPGSLQRHPARTGMNRRDPGARSRGSTSAPVRRDEPGTSWHGVATEGCGHDRTRVKSEQCRRTGGQSRARLAAWYGYSAEQ